MQNSGIIYNSIKDHSLTQMNINLHQYLDQSIDQHDPQNEKERPIQKDETVLDNFILDITNHITNHNLCTQRVDKVCQLAKNLQPKGLWHLQYTNKLSLIIHLLSEMSQRRDISNWASNSAKLKQNKALLLKGSIEQDNFCKDQNINKNNQNQCRNSQNQIKDPIANDKVANQRKCKKIKKEKKCQQRQNMSDSSSKADLQQEIRNSQIQKSQDNSLKEDDKSKKKYELPYDANVVDKIIGKLEEEIFRVEAMYLKQQQIHKVLSFKELQNQQLCDRSSRKIQKQAFYQELSQQDQHLSNECESPQIDVQIISSKQKQRKIEISHSKIDEFGGNSNYLPFLNMMETKKSSSFQLPPLGQYYTSLMHSGYRLTQHMFGNSHSLPHPLSHSLPNPLLNSFPNSLPMNNFYLFNNYHNLEQQMNKLSTNVQKSKRSDEFEQK